MPRTENIDRPAEVERGPKPTARTLLTRAGAETLAAEVARLRHELDVEFAARLRTTRAFGAPNNNDEYLQIKEEEAIVEARVRQLEAVLGAAQIVDETVDADDMVTIGSLVEVEDLASGVVREHKLAGGFESYGRGHVSANSPVGRALLARRPGDEVTVELPTGRSLRLRVLAVNRRGRR
jgi:transcription elongation GreA/GreB family factor